MDRYIEMVFSAAALAFCAVLIFGSDDLVRSMSLPNWLVTRRRWFGALGATCGAAVIATAYLA